MHFLKGHGKKKGHGKIKKVWFLWWSYTFVSLNPNNYAFGILC